MADKSLDALQTGLLKGVRKRLFLQRLRSSLSTIILLVSSAIFIFLLIDVSEGDVIGIDHFAYRLFVVHLRTPLLTEIMEGFSGLASPVTVIVMLIVVAAFAPGPSVGRLASINLGGVVIVDLIFKAIVQRPRPDGFRLVVETGYSFPSGHSMFSMAFYGLLIWLVWHYEKDKLQRWIWCGDSIAYLQEESTSSEDRLIISALTTWADSSSTIMRPIVAPSRPRG